MKALLDGRPGDAVALDSRGLAYGDGVFRTLLVVDGAALHVDDHLAALARDAQRLDLQMPSPALLLADTRILAAGQARAVVKWLLVRRSEGRGYRPATRAATRIVLRSPAPRYEGDPWRQGIVADWSTLTLGIQPALAGVKHLNRLEQVLASRELGAGIDERLMCDHDGRVIGGTRSNLFWVTDGVLCTPRLDRCGIAGTMRARLLQLARGLGVDVRELEAPRDALLGAQEAFVSNALIGLWPLRRVGSRDYPAPGVLTQRLMQQLRHPSLN
ncbi:aminodeoxychorismate lyase [Solimonas flava]|uniref:aminodeoxychorismate lyase n=1 Tax=Solimonas flava TaxID=415849 RepID=UPI0003FC4190|nr:aminodeoxychorismate lyase [Solimonas flava]